MPPLQARFDGTATLALGHPLWTAPMTAQLSVDLTFSEDRWTVTVGQIPAFQKIVDTPVGVNTATLRILNKRANYFPEAALRHPNWGAERSSALDPVPARTLEMQLEGRLEHSISLAPIADIDSYFYFDGILSRRPPPPVRAQIDAAGNVSLWDDGRFETGILSLRPTAETRYTLTINGQIVPAPGLTPTPPPPEPHLTVVPDVVGMQRSGARAMIEEAGLLPRFTGAAGARTDVSSQSPGDGAIVERGTTVHLHMSRLD